MTAYAGSILYAIWIHPSGTVTLAPGDYRTLNINNTLEFIDATAGADSARVRIASFGDMAVTWNAVLQQNDGSLIAAVARAREGTLIIGVEGSATGKPKLTLPAISLGPSYAVSYNNVVEFSCTFQGNGAHTDGTF